MDEENSHRFYQLPKELFVNEKYKHLNSDAKLLYALLLDRKELSRKNNWVDEDNQVYLLYSRDNIAEMLGISRPTASKAFKQLVQADLIIEERQGLTKPNKIFVCRIEYSSNTGRKDSLHQEEKIVSPNDTDVSETEKTKRYTITSNGGYVFSYYNFKYKEQNNKDHPTVTLDQLNSMENIIDIFHEYNVGPDDWTNAIDEHFEMVENNPANNGNILGFITGDDMAGPLVRYLNIK